MKMILFILSITMLFGVTGCGTHMKHRPVAKWENPNNWDDLEPGMNVAQVRARLGKPPLIGDFQESGYENWYYPDSDGGVVQIDAERRVVAVRKPQVVVINYLR